MNKVDNKGFSGDQSQETSSQTTPVVGEAAKHDHEELDSPGIETRLKNMILNFHVLCTCISNREHYFFKRKHA